MFIEFIWLDGTPICQESERVTIGERGRGAGLPLGVSWRGDFSVECSPYGAPYLPDGVSIPVLQASLDIAMPLVFGSPFGVPPAERTGDRFAVRQLPNIKALHKIRIGLKNPDPVSGALNGIEKVELVRSSHESVEITVVDNSGKLRSIINWQLSHDSA